MSAIFFVGFYIQFSSREFTFDGSGRLDGYLYALRAFENSPLVGVMFNREYFLANYGTLPHNLFLYVLSQGGIVFLLLFVLWFFNLAYVVLYYHLFYIKLEY